MGDVRYVMHTHLHIDHAGKDELFPMNTTVLLNRRELSTRRAPTPRAR
jgi:glyoxylase-like metal-dependent hydrolase (beta-lactamase superfamily II)